MLHVRDRIVCSISDKAVRRLLWEPDLTCDKALEIALAAEAVEKDSKRLSDNALVQTQEKETPVPPGVNRVGQHKIQYVWQGVHSVLGIKSVIDVVESFKGYECHFCKKKGHLPKEG